MPADDGPEREPDQPAGRSLDGLSVEQLRARCARSVSGHRPVPPDKLLAELASSPYAALPWDSYGEGEAVGLLEDRVAGLLGTEAAVFVPKGVIAQQAALRVWTERARRPTVAVHPRSHLDLDEDGAYEHLHDLRPLRLGGDHAPFTVAALADAHVPVGAVTVELPLRRSGFVLPPWEELVAIGAWSRAHGAALHLDGARLWTCPPYYGRPLPEIAAVADSVYVSLYKDVGGLAGCVLAGAADFLAETQVWLRRHGAPLYRALPYVVAALDGLDRHLPRIDGYVARAREVAAALAAHPDLRVLPDPPHTNGFTVALPAGEQAVAAACRAVAARSGVWVAGRAVPTALPDVSLVEVQIGDASDDVPVAEIVALFAEVAERARSGALPANAEVIAGTSAGTGAG